MEGKLEGKIEGKIEVILNGYDNGISVSLLANITQFSEEEIMKILVEHGKKL